MKGLTCHILLRIQPRPPLFTHAQIHTHTDTYTHTYLIYSVRRPLQVACVDYCNWFAQLNGRRGRA